MHPPAGARQFPLANWFSLELMATRHGLAPWSETHWSMIRRYAELMAHGRQNTFRVCLEDVFAMTEGRPVLNSARLRRLVEIFTGAGMFYIEGGHFGGRTAGSGKAPLSAWCSPMAWPPRRRAMRTSPPSRTSSKRRSTPTAGSSAGCSMFADEPIAESAADYRIFTGMVRKYLPGFPIVDATMYEGLVGAVDIWCPQAQEYQRHQQFFATQRAVGDRVWYYTCCCPGGPWLNRLLDIEMLRPALFGWAAALFQLDGFLHWGLNHYRPEQDPFQMSVVGHGGSNYLPAGDTHVVYPGAGAPWSSVRFKAQREGCRGCAAAPAPARDGAVHHRPGAQQGFDDYAKDPAVFRAARKELLESADLIGPM